MFLTSLLFNLGCKKTDNNNNNSNNNLVACFSTDKATYALGETAIITNCSERATNYSWTIRSATNAVVFTLDGDISSYAIPNDGTIPIGTYIITLKAYGNDDNGNIISKEITKIITITTTNNTTLGTPNPGPHTTLKITKIEILGYPEKRPNNTNWDSEQSWPSYFPDMFIKIQQQVSTGVVDFFNNQDDAFSDDTYISDLFWNYASNPKSFSIPKNIALKLNISLRDDEGFNSSETMSVISDIDLFSTANYGKPTLTFTQGDFSIKLTIQWL
jgi:hypothetical protein